MSFAEKTTVSVDRSQSEIKKILSKYNATGFAFGENGPISLVMFEMRGRRIKFILPMPEKQKTRDKRGYLMSQNQVEQESRRRWRCLTLAIKAKLECVESGIATFEEEFMAHIVLPNGNTVGQAVLPQINQSYKDGKMPPLLGYNP